MTKNTQHKVQQTDQLTFPPDFPEGVPPANAIAANGEFYRLTKAKPPSKDCFLSMKEENPKRMNKFNGLKLKCCYGISMYTDESSLINAFDKFPEGIGERFVAKGKLDASDGRMLKTGAPDTTHYTVWLHSGRQIHDKFSCIRGLAK